MALERARRGAGPQSLVFLLCSDELLGEQLSEQLAEIDPGVELHVVRDVEALAKHAERLTPDLLIVDAQSVEGAPAELLHAPVFGRAPSLVLDGASTPARKREVLEAGATEYVTRTKHLTSLREAYLRTQRVRRFTGPAEETEQHFRDILEASSDGIFVLIDGVFYFVNGTFAQMLGCHAAELVDHKRLADFVAEGERAAACEELSRIEVSSGARDVFDIAVRSCDGRTLRLEVACRASTVEGRRAVVGVARDVTAVREIQDEIDRARQRAAQVERLRALGELAAGVAHDFNNTLETIIGRIGIAREKAARGEPVDKELLIIESASRDAANTVQRIRDFARPTGTDSWHDVDLTAVVYDAAEFARTGVPEGVDFRVEAKPTPRIRGNGAELREVLLNLLHNAFDAVEPGGNVALRCFAEDDNAVVVVEDNGHGMPPAVQRRIFEPFFTTKGEAGTGLGLSVSHGILRRHDAQMHLESEPGRGTRFHLVFAAIAPAPRDRPAQLSERLSVLVVDDDDNVAELVHDLLEEHGHRVVTASDVAQAIKYVSEQTPDLMITDLDLPGMSGWQLARRVRELHPQIMIGLITGWPLGAPDHELRTRGVDFVLTKPFSLDQLLGALRGLRPSA